LYENFQVSGSLSSDATITANAADDRLRFVTMSRQAEHQTETFFLPVPLRRVKRGTIKLVAVISTANCKTDVHVRNFRD
jgi:hypothetical protein